VPELGSLGSVRGALSNARPYREHIRAFGPARREHTFQIELPAEQQGFIGRAVADGRVRSAEGAVREALALWVERERRREEALAAIDEAEASLARGEGLVFTRPSMKEVAEDVKRRGRARLPAEKKAGADGVPPIVVSSDLRRYLASDIGRGRVPWPSLSRSARRRSFCLLRMARSLSLHWALRHST